MCLVEHGADVNKENRNGETPLFMACVRRNKDLVDTWWNMEQI